jgi:hypothetical protein
MDFLKSNSNPQIEIIVLKKETIARWLVLPVWQRHGLPRRRHWRVDRLAALRYFSSCHNIVTINTQNLY